MKPKPNRINKIVGVALHPEQLAALDKIAKKRKVSRHLLMVNAIVLYLDLAKNKATP